MGLAPTGLALPPRTCVRSVTRYFTVPTLLRSRVKGSTPLSTRFDPEDLREIVKARTRSTVRSSTSSEVASANGRLRTAARPASAAPVRS